MESNDKINNNENEYNNLKPTDFQDLTPIDDVDLTGYEEALDHAFKKEDKIKNIAITGSYGSGKSSILYTYEKKNPKLKFLHVSFLHFKECDKNDTNTNENKEKSNNNKEDGKESKDIEENKEQDSDNKDIEENKEDKDTTKIEFSLDCGKETKNEIDKDKIREAVLERKIINHIINQIPFEYISDTNFNVRGNIGIVQAVTKVLFGMAILYVISFFANDKLNKLLDSLKLTSESNQYKASEYILLYCFIYILIYLIILFKKLRWKNVFKRLNFKNIELDLDKLSNDYDKYDSFFDRYLNEILYIFENCKADVIVFEDIDRLEMRIIFERLREINVLLNERLKKKNKVIKFCYLIRDDIFNSEDRVKIFDFIIPVIPTMNSFNAYHTFKNYFKDYIDELNSELVFEICKHINDIRILKNVYNEFLIYIKKLCIKDISLNYNRILSIIIYKNLFPRDFNDINYNTGFLFNMFRYSYVREQMLIEIEKNLEINVNNFRKEIDIIKNNLKKIYIEDVSYSDIEIYIINSIYSDTKYAGFINIKGIDTDVYDYINFKYYKYKKCSENIKERLDKIFDNSDLENIKKMKLNIFKNEYDIDNVKYIQYSNVSNDLLYRIFKKCLNFSKDKTLSKYHTFLWYLLKNRFIDELSLDFITCNFENTNDNKFILNLFIGKENLGFDYKLDDPVYIIMKCGYTIFLNNTKIYNFYLLDTMLSFLNKYYGDHQNYHNKIRAFFIHLRDNFDFVIEYFNRNIIKNMNLCNIKLVEWLDDFKIKFKHIECYEFDLRLLEFIEKFNLYDITYAHLRLILKNMYGYDEDEIFYKNYSLIYKNKNNQIYKYINENIFEYFYMLVDKVDYIYDNEEAVIDLINSLFTEGSIFKYWKDSKHRILGLFEKYFEKLKYKINAFNICVEEEFIEFKEYENNIRKKIYIQMFKYNIIKFYIENIYDYNNKINEIDYTIINFINKSSEELKIYNKCLDYDIEDVRVFLNELKNDERIIINKRKEIQSCIDELDKF